MNPLEAARLRRHAEAREQVQRERAARYPEVTAANVAEVIAWQEKRMGQLLAPPAPLRVERIMPHVIGLLNIALLVGLLSIWTPSAQGGQQIVLWVPLALFMWNIYSYVRWLDN